MILVSAIALIASLALVSAGEEKFYYKKSPPGASFGD